MSVDESVAWLVYLSVDEWGDGSDGESVCVWDDESVGESDWAWDDGSVAWLVAWSGWAWDD